MQMFVPPSPLTSTWTLSGSVPHEKSLMSKASLALPGAIAIIAAAAMEMTGTNRRVEVNQP
jgi:hypothetical protein